MGGSFTSLSCVPLSRSRCAKSKLLLYSIFNTLSVVKLPFGVRSLLVSLLHKSRSVHSRFRSHAQSMCTISLSNCFTLNFVYSLQFESPSSVCFCYPPSASLCCTFYCTVFAMSLLLTLASLFAFGGVRCLQGLDSYTHIRLETHTQVASR